MPDPLLIALGIVLTSLITEDGATAAAAALAAGGKLDLPTAFASAFAGIWIGDLGLYALARALGPTWLHRPALRRFVSEEKLRSARQWFDRRGPAALVLCRFLPGTRLATYVTAGALSMPAHIFSAITAVCAAVWVAAAFLLARLSVPQAGARRGYISVALLAFAGAVAFLALRRTAEKLAPRLRLTLARLRRWEFWPAWLFYAPVPLMCFWLGIRHRGWSLPAVANPGQHNGGIVGESKAAILRELFAIAPEQTAQAWLLAPGLPAERMRALEHICAAHRLQPPFVLKPDVAQRGEGFRKIESFDEAWRYLENIAAPIVAQRYAAGPNEAGLFYYRFPGSDRGEIFAITEKLFPCVIGDGLSTAAQLIEQDERARLIASTYLDRLGPAADSVLASGETLRLVEAGNHCQGCIFRDGSHLYSEALRATFDRISQALPGFYIGRYDVRYTTADELRAGRGFTIIELNGAASEATSIYDARNSLCSAYRTLYRQWQLVFAIGRANRDRGFCPPSLFSVWNDWRAYVKMAAAYPAAD